MKPWDERIAEARKRGRWTKQDEQQVYRIYERAHELLDDLTFGEFDEAARTIEKLRRAVE